MGENPAEMLYTDRNSAGFLLANQSCRVLAETQTDYCRNRPADFLSGYFLSPCSEICGRLLNQNMNITT